MRAPSIGSSISREVRPVSEIPHRLPTGTMSHGGYMSLPFRCSLRTVLLVQSNQLSFRPSCNSCPRYVRHLWSGECAQVCQVLSGEGCVGAATPLYTVCRKVSDPTPKTLKSDPRLLLLLIRPPSGLHCHQTPPTHCQINGVLFQCRRPGDLEWGSDGE